MKNSSRLRYPNGLVLRLRLTPHFMGCFSPVLSEITFRVSSASGDSPYSQIKKPAVFEKVPHHTEIYCFPDLLHRVAAHTAFQQNVHQFFREREIEVYSRNKLPFLSVGSGKFLTVILLVLELSRIMCNGYLLILLQYRRKALRPEKLIADILRHHIVQRFHKSQSLSHTWQRRVIIST